MFCIDVNGFLHRKTWRPSYFQPGFCATDICLIYSANLLESGEAKQIWPYVLRMFRSVHNRAQRMTEMFETLCSRFSRLQTIPFFESSVRELCLPGGDFLKENKRELTIQNSDASDKSDGFSCLITNAEEEATPIKKPQKVEPATPDTIDQERDPIPANMSNNLTSIGSVIYFRDVSISQCKQAQELKQSPDCPKMLSNLAGCQFF